MKKNKKQKSTAGYTIIETMIAVSLFIVVVMAGMGSLLNANLLHQKSQNMRSIMDNLSFIMEDMSKNLRTGYDYGCFDYGNRPSNNFPIASCSNGGMIVFEPENGIPDDPNTPGIQNSTDQWVYSFMTCDGYAGICKSTEGNLNLTQLVPKEVTIFTPQSRFIVSGAEPSSIGDEQQPFVTIRLVGEINLKGVKTPFSLQTSVSQRKIDR